MANDGIRGEQLSGAALIVDAEGSTALSESLQRHGNEGAEALAAVLKSVFTPIVEFVNEAGGFVAEFAGDGVLALFPGELDTSVDRAIGAARRIMDQLGSLDEVTTPQGDARLTVRSVVGAGTIESNVWVAPAADIEQRAVYTYRGTAVEEAQHGERVIPGNVLGVGAIAQMHMSPRVPVESLGDGFVAVGGFEPTTPDRTDSEGPAPVALVPFFPPSLEQTPESGEFRDVVSAFVELRRMPDQTSGSQMTTLLNLLAEHRGYVCNVTSPGPDADGVRVLLFWGAPMSRERDIGYALRFVADLKNRLGGQEVRAGITHSTVFAGFVGTPDQASYTCVGSGVNLAARMCASADWGQIRVNDAIQLRLDPPWALEDLGPKSYRGFRDRTETFAVTHVPAVRQPDPFRGAFVGRVGEIDSLEDLMAPLWDGRSAGIIAVSGDAGSGKSRLINELRGRLADRVPTATWLEARADAIRSQPLATLRDALAGYFGRPGAAETGANLSDYMSRLAEDAPDMSEELMRARATLADLVNTDGEESAEHSLKPKDRFENVVLAVEDLVLALEELGPVIVVVADGQWIDEGTAQVLSRMQRDLASARVGLIIETRDADVGIEPDHRVDMSSLTDTDIDELARQFLGRPPSEKLVAFISDRSSGNAFHARQLLEYLDRIGLLEPDTELSATDLTDEVPADLRRVLVSRLDELPPSVRRTVQVASVLGRDVDLDVLASMVGDASVLSSHVESVVGARIWTATDDGNAQFRSLLTRDAAYGMLTHVDIQALHEAAAYGIEQVHGSGESAAARLAFHYDLADLPDLAADHYVVAGRVAASRFANAEALAHLERAYELLAGASAHTRFSVVASMYEVHDTLGQRSEQEIDVGRMEAIAGDDVVLGVEAALLRARLLSEVGSYAEAVTSIETASELAGDDSDTAERGNIELLMAKLARYQGRGIDAEKHAAAARASYVAAAESVRVASVDDFVGGIAWESGDFEAAAALHRSAAQTFRRHGEATDEIRALNNLGSALFSMGDYSAARLIHEAGALRSQEIGYRLGEGDHLDNTGGTAWAVGDYELAIDRYSAALAIRERADDAWGIAISKGNLGATRRALGYPADGLGLYREALQIDQRIGRRRGEAYDLHGMGLCQLDLERYNLASEALAQAASIRAEIDEAHLANESNAAWAVAMLRRGDEQEALALVEAILEAEGPEPFEGAVETTASLLRCVEVLQISDPSRAAELRRHTAKRVRERSTRISDPTQRGSYLNGVRDHRLTLAE